MALMDFSRVVASGSAWGAGHPRLAKYPLRHPQVSLIFNISSVVPAVSELALAPSCVSFPVAGPRAHIFVATPLDLSNLSTFFFLELCYHDVLFGVTTVALIWYAAR